MLLCDVGKRQGSLLDLCPNVREGLRIGPVFMNDAIVPVTEYHIVKEGRTPQIATGGAIA